MNPLPLNRLLAAASLVFLTPALHAEELHSFQAIQLSDQFWSEGANFGDLNNDKINDIISGPYWWEGPDFKKRHEYYPGHDYFPAAARAEDHGHNPRFRRRAWRGQ